MITSGDNVESLGKFESGVVVKEGLIYGSLVFAAGVGILTTINQFITVPYFGLIALVIAVAGFIAIPLKYYIDSKSEFGKILEMAQMEDYSIYGQNQEKFNNFVDLAVGKR